MRKSMLTRAKQGLALALCVLASGAAVAADEPIKVRMAAILATGPDSSFDGTFLNSWERVRESNPHNVELSEVRYTEGVWGDSAEAAMRGYAKTGKFDIIWAHASYSDQVKRIKKKYPEVMFVTVNSGNENLGGNHYLVYGRLHEPSYLLGIHAGMMTESNIIGAVGTFPADDVNDSLQAFAEGAKSVNPGVKMKYSFIESWWDPPMAHEASNAQVSLGVDMMFQNAESFQACEEAGIICFGQWRDLHEIAPTAILSSAVHYWDPHINWVLGEFLRFKKTGKWNGNMDKKWFGMADGAAEITPYYSLDDRVPAEVKAKVAQVREKIISGEFEVPLLVEIPVSD